MDYILEIFDKSQRKIHLSEERWKHIRKEHPKIVDVEQIKKVLIHPDKIIQSDRDPNVCWYYLFNKIKKRYLKVSVKYLNGTGYVITAHYTTKIQ